MGESEMLEEYREHYYRRWGVDGVKAWRVPGGGAGGRRWGGPGEEGGADWSKKKKLVISYAGVLAAAQASLGLAVGLGAAEIVGVGRNWMRLKFDGREDLEKAREKIEVAVRKWQGGKYRVEEGGIIYLWLKDLAGDEEAG